ncbi:MAG: hypothetical protein ACLFUB_11080 [Cyclobacteriaceae bacterium]
MRTPSRPNKPQRAQPDEQQNTQLVVDFELREGLMFLLIQNFGPTVAREVRISFNQAILVLNAEKKLNELNIFRKLRYLAPYKTIEVFLDPASLFLLKLKDKEVAIKLSYQDAQGKTVTEEIIHDLSIYTDLPILLNHQHHG